MDCDVPLRAHPQHQHVEPRQRHGPPEPRPPTARRTSPRPPPVVEGRRSRTDRGDPLGPARPPAEQGLPRAPSLRAGASAGTNRSSPHQTSTSDQSNVARLGGQPGDVLEDRGADPPPVSTTEAVPCTACAAESRATSAVGDRPGQVLGVGLDDHVGAGPRGPEPRLLGRGLAGRPGCAPSLSSPPSPVPLLPPSPLPSSSGAGSNQTCSRTGPGDSPVSRWRPPAPRRRARRGPATPPFSDQLAQARRGARQPTRAGTAGR